MLNSGAEVVRCHAHMLLMGCKLYRTGRRGAIMLYLLRAYKNTELPHLRIYTKENMKSREVYEHKDIRGSVL